MRRENMFLNSKVESIRKVPISICEQYEQKVSLKTFTSADIDDFMEWATDDEVTRY